MHKSVNKKRRSGNEHWNGDMAWLCLWVRNFWLAVAVDWKEKMMVKTLENFRFL